MISTQNVSPKNSESGDYKMHYYDYDMKESGERIQQLRKSREMTQEELAAALRIGGRHLRKIESGERGLSIDISVELSKLFDVSLDYIIVGRQTPDDLKKKLSIAIRNLSELVDTL
jgi:transcriptional regulator with XRE-family HTH domain